MSRQGAPAILDARQEADEKRLARLCVALARSNALLTAWQALAIALVEPELREAIGDSEEIAKLDVVLGNAPALAAWFEQPVRSAAATELRAMLDNAVVLPAVQSASLAQWFDKPVARLASIAAEHLARQLEAQGMRALPFVLGVPSSPAFRELMAQASAQLRRIWVSVARSPTRQPAPSLTDRWIGELYREARYVGRARSDVVARGDASENDGVRESIAERAIDEEWITLADLRASLDEPARIEWPQPEPEIALVRPRSAARTTASPRAAPSVARADEVDVSPRSAPAREATGQEGHPSAHLGLAIFAGALAGIAAIAMFMAVAGRKDRHPVPSATEEPLALGVPVATGESPRPALATSAPALAAPIDPGEAQPEPASSGLAASPPGAATAAPVASLAATSRMPISKTCDLALMYAQRGEIAQAIRRFESCLASEREWVRQGIGKRSAAEVRAKAEKGQCDEAAALVAQVETIDAADAAKAAFASLCDSHAREIKTETAGP